MAGPAARRRCGAGAESDRHDLLGMIDRGGAQLMAHSVVVLRPAGRALARADRLPIVEGLAHGCHIVATPDTGLKRVAPDARTQRAPDGFTWPTWPPRSATPTRNPLDPGAAGPPSAAGCASGGELDARAASNDPWAGAELARPNRDGNQRRLPPGSKEHDVCRRIAILVLVMWV